MNSNPIDEILEAYERRDARREGGLVSFRHLTIPYNILRRQELDRAMLGILRDHFETLEDKKILDVGCGIGYFLRLLVSYGARPVNCVGVDMLASRTEIAKSLNPAMEFHTGDAANLNYPSQCFDVVHQSTVFSSIKNMALKKAVAEEMLRVLKPDGIILWYDFFYNNPGNSDVKRVRKKEIKELFHPSSITFRRMTLAPPIARLISAISPLAWALLSKVSFLCSHYLATIVVNAPFEKHT